MTHRIELTTEELSLLSDGTRLTFAIGTEVFKFSADDLDISLSELVEGQLAHFGPLEISYS